MHVYLPVLQEQALFILDSFTNLGRPPVRFVGDTFPGNFRSILTRDG